MPGFTIVHPICRWCANQSPGSPMIRLGMTWPSGTPISRPHNRREGRDLVRNVIACAAAASVAILAGCGPNYSPNTYDAAAVQQANKVTQGEVVGVRKVGVSADTTLGTVTGAAAGGIAGSQVGTTGPITALTTLGGTVVGGLVGSGVQHVQGDTAAYEYIVRQTDNTLVSVTQRDTVPLAVGEKVLVIAGKQARVVPDYTVSLPGVPPGTPKTAAKTPGASGPAGSASLVPPGVDAGPAGTPATAAASSGSAGPGAGAPAQTSAVSSSPPATPPVETAPNPSSVVPALTGGATVAGAPAISAPSPASLDGTTPSATGTPITTDGTATTSATSTSPATAPASPVPPGETPSLLPGAAQSGGSAGAPVSLALPSASNAAAAPSLPAIPPGLPSPAAPPDGSAFATPATTNASRP